MSIHRLGLPVTGAAGELLARLLKALPAADVVATVRGHRSGSEAAIPAVGAGR